MQTAKYSLAVAMSFVLIAWLLCSQVCDLNCTVYGCSISASAPTEAPKSSAPHSHCHNHDSKQAPQSKQRQAPSCPGHFDIAARTPSLNPLRAADQPPALALPVYVAFYSRTPNATSTIPTVSAPDRSPPANSVLRI
jgi:hypothetical protein